MGIFLDYLSNPFSNLDDTPTTIVETTQNNICVQSIIITNLGTKDIRVNLKFIRSSSSPADIFLIKDFLIPHSNNTIIYNNQVLFNTMDLIKIPGLTVNLQYDATISESLQVFSSGYTQIFDCSVVYAELNDLPVAP